MRKKGEAALKGSFFGNLMKGKTERQDDAKEFFSQAANCYKLDKKLEESVEMYLKCAECESEEGFKANFYRDAAQAIKSIDGERYVKLNKQAIELFFISGRTSQASTLQKTCAEKLEEEYNYEDARSFYKEAAYSFEISGQPTYCNSMNSKWADLSVLLGDFDKIAEIIKTYEKIGKNYLSTSLVKSAAKDYFFKASLCFLANEDLPGTKRALENYSLDDPSFDDCRYK